MDRRNLPARDQVAVAGWTDQPHAGVPVAIFLTSAALLGLEISLTRFFSFTVWYHFAYLTISMALLGFGSSGALVAAFPQMFARRGQRLLEIALVLAGLLAIGGISFLAQYPIEIENSFRKPLHFSVSMLVYYAIVAAPFLLAGFSISVPFAAYPERMGRLYFWDLVGASFGCGAVVLGIEALGVPGLIYGSATLLLLAAAALALGVGARGRAVVLLAMTAGATVLTIAGAPRLPISIASTKNMMDLRRSVGILPETTDRDDMFHKWTAINRVDAFGWKQPTSSTYWSALGLARGWTGFKPEAAHLTYDGSNGSDLYAFHGDIQGEFQMLDHHLLHLPYVVLTRPKVLVIGVGGGIDLFNAVKNGASHVTGAELQKETVHLLHDRLPEFTGGFYLRDDVTLVASEGRHFVRQSTDQFDLVQITAVDTFAAQAAGAYVMAESYLYTVEAMQDYLRHLTPDGLVTIVVGDIAYGDTLAPLATRTALIGYRALERMGIGDPAKHLIVVASTVEGSFGQDQSILVKKSPFTPEEVRRVVDYANDNKFRVLFAPDGGSYEMSQVLGPDEEVRARTLEQAPFHMEPTYDTNPFYYNIGKWRSFATNKSLGVIAPGSFMGQLVLVLMVLQSFVLGAILIIGPLLRGTGDSGQARSNLFHTPGLFSYFCYFVSIGLGFMFIEISFVQTFVLFLGSPTHALSVTILSLLLFTGIGSFASERFAARPAAALRRLSWVVAVLVIGYSIGLARVFDLALHLDLPVRIVIAILAQLPIGLALGMFMPLGVAAILRRDPRLVPWAWGINGVGSVTGTTLAVLLGMSFGFRVVAVAAAALYLAGTAMLRRAHPAD